MKTNSKLPKDSEWDAATLPVAATPQPRRGRLSAFKTFGIKFVLSLAAVLFTFITWYKTRPSPANLPTFRSHVRIHNELCPGYNYDAISRSGYISLGPDNAPKRAFFWLFQAQTDDWVNRPLILTIGGGPGVSGMMYPLKGESHCVVEESGVTANKYAWTKNYNLLALDHPIGAGYSYGPSVSSSELAAADAYEFLQKFFTLFPKLRENKFIISSASYGGLFVPHIASLIHRKNVDGNPHIHLDSVIVSGAYTDAHSFYSTLHEQRCDRTRVYNDATCTIIEDNTAACLASIAQYYTNTTNSQFKTEATSNCRGKLDRDTDGTNVDNVAEKCTEVCLPDFGCPGTSDDCHRQSSWSQKFLDMPSTKHYLGVETDRPFIRASDPISSNFHSAGDELQRGHLLYQPLLQGGHIRMLHLVGENDANCGLLGVLAFLKLIVWEFQEDFQEAEEMAWPGKDATVYAGDSEHGGDRFALIKVGRAGHIPVMDRPELVQEIVERWIGGEQFI